MSTTNTLEAEQCASLIVKYQLEHRIKRNHTEGLSDMLSSIPQERKEIENVAYAQLRKQLQERVDELYPSINLSFLSMRGKEIALEWDFREERRGFSPVSWAIDFPRFAIYSLESPLFSLYLSRSYQGYTRRNWDWPGELCEIHLAKPKLFEDSASYRPIGTKWRPGEIDYYPSLSNKKKSLHHQIFEMLLSGITVVEEKPIIKKIISRAITAKKILKGQEQDEYLVHNFLGFLPQKTRQRIEGAEHIFGKNIYLIGEADEWSYQTVEYAPRARDPLVIGILKDKSYLIDQFDMTPIERYVAGEFLEGKA